MQEGASKRTDYVAMSIGGAQSIDSRRGRTMHSDSGRHRRMRSKSPAPQGRRRLAENDQRPTLITQFNADDEGCDSMPKIWRAGYAEQNGVPRRQSTATNRPDNIVTGSPSVLNRMGRRMTTTRRFGWADEQGAVAPTATEPALHKPTAERKEDSVKGRAVAPKRMVQSMFKAVTKSTRLVPSIRRVESFECEGSTPDVLRDIRKILEFDWGGLVQNERSGEFRVQVPLNFGYRTALCTVTVSGEEVGALCRIQVYRSISESMRGGSEDFEWLCSKVFDQLLERRSVCR